MNESQVGKDIGLWTMRWDGQVGSQGSQDRVPKVRGEPPAL